MLSILNRSLINENSDTFIFQQLQPELLAVLKGLCKSGVTWTEAIGSFFKLST